MKVGDKILICTHTKLYGECLQQIIDKNTNYNADLLCLEEDLGEYIEKNYVLLICDLTFLHYMASHSLNHEKVFLIGGDTNITLNKDPLKNFVSVGLSGILSHESDCKIFLKAIDKIIDGELWLSRSISKTSLRCNSSNNHVSITNKEAEVFNYVCLGLSNREIAFKLKIGEKTVKTHCNHLFKKLGVSNRVQLILNYSMKESPF